MNIGRWAGDYCWILPDVLSATVNHKYSIRILPSTIFDELVRASPIRDGLRALRRAPALFLCEIVWRWTFALAFWAVIVVCMWALMANVRVGDTEYQLSRALRPFSVIIVVAHLIGQLGFGLRHVAPVVVVGLAMLWLLLASVGRLATLKVLLSQTRTNWPSVFALNLLRLLLTTTAALAFVGAGLMVSRNRSPSGDDAGVGVLAMLLIAIVITFFWSLLNWFLSLALIWAVRDGAGPASAMRESVSLLVEASGPYVGAWAWIEFMRWIVIALALFASFIPIRMASMSSARAVAIVIGLALYCAAMDFIQIWRIAAYVALAESEQLPASSNLAEWAPPLPPAVPPSPEPAQS